MNRYQQQFEEKLSVYSLNLEEKHLLTSHHRIIPLIVLVKLHQNFPEYVLVHNIRQSKLFVVQTLLEIAELKNYWGSRGSQYLKQISEMNPE